MYSKATMDINLHLDWRWCDDVAFNKSIIDSLKYVKTAMRFQLKIN